MRRVAAIQTCLAIVLAFGFAPFQHVHADHGHGVVVHSHTYAHSHSHIVPSGPAFDDNDDHTGVRSLDTFTLTFAPRVALFILIEQTLVESDVVPAFDPIVTIEACAHDPPLLERLNPRAPPV